MKINIKREEIVSYEVYLRNKTLLDLLYEIKMTIDPSLAFNSGCRSGVCGSCALRVNGKEVLACTYRLKDGDLVEPLNNLPILRDLCVDMQKAYNFNVKAKAYQSSKAEAILLSTDDEKLNEIQSNCILCASCYSTCPVYTINSEFLGPFALTRVWRYMSDKREVNKKEKIDNIQTNGIWDCTLCNACTLVCPQEISSKADIEKLRARSVMFGYNDPSFTSFGGGFGFDGTPSF